MLEGEVPKEIQTEEVRGPLKEENNDKALTGVKTLLSCPGSPAQRDPWSRVRGQHRPFPQLEEKGDVVGGRKQLPFNSLVALAALTAPNILDPWGAITSARPTPGPRPSFVYIALIYRGLLRTHERHSSLQPGWGSLGPHYGEKWAQVLGGSGRVDRGGCVGWRTPGSGAQTTRSAAAGKHQKWGPIQPY